MKVEIEEKYNFIPTKENGYGYSELVALPNGKAVGLSSNVLDRIYKLQIFDDESINHLDIPQDLFDNSIAPNVLFAVNNQPIIITRKLIVIFISEDLSDFEVSKISGSLKVFKKKEELNGRIPHFGLHSGNSLNNEVMLSMSYSSLYKQNELVKISINERKGTAKWIPLYTKKESWLKKSYCYRSTLDLEQFPKNFGYPIWSSSPIVFSILNMDDGFLIYSCGDWVTKGSGHSYNCISRISNDLNLKRHLYVENYHEKKDGKNWGKFGVFSSDNKYCILTPKYKKKVEENWFGKQRLYNIENNSFEDLELPRGFTKYQLKDMNNRFCWFEYWDMKNHTKHLVKGKRK